METEMKEAARKRRFALQVVPFANRTTAAGFRRSAGPGGRARMAGSPEVTARRVLVGGKRITQVRRPRFFSSPPVRQHAVRASL